jgi:DNA-binding XRE family transcriptional regulator
MTKVQFIKTTGGEELAVLPKREYDRLAAFAVSEDRGVARIVRRARAALATGREIVLPKTVVDRLAAGENPVRVLRTWRDMTQAELVLRVGITQGYLSDIEAEKRRGPIALHQKIARALDVPIDLLLPAAVPNHAHATHFSKRGQAAKYRIRARRRR